LKGVNEGALKLSMKLDALCDPMLEEDLKFITENRELLYSLCNPEALLKTYLSLKPDIFLNQNIGSDLSNSTNKVAIRLVLSEVTYNQFKLGLTKSTSGLVTDLPFYPFDQKFGFFKGALIIGPWYLEFCETSLCIPKRIHPVMKRMYQKFSPILKLNQKIGEVVVKLSNFIADWNSNYQYVGDHPDSRNKEANGYTFIKELIETLKPNFKGFQGSLENFLLEMKDFGDAGPSVYPAKSSEEFLKKFQFTNIRELNDHSLLDNTLSGFIDVDPSFDKNFPHDYLLFQSLDAAMWIRYIKNGAFNFTPNNVQMVNSKKYICPCFNQKLISDILKLSEGETDEIEYFMNETEEDGDDPCENEENGWQVLKSIKFALEARDSGSLNNLKSESPEISSVEETFKLKERKFRSPGEIFSELSKPLRSGHKSPRSPRMLDDMFDLQESPTELSEKKETKKKNLIFAIKKKNSLGTMENTFK
jgi:hypothetical protein